MCKIELRDFICATKKKRKEKRLFCEHHGCELARLSKPQGATALETSTSFA
jgi:hypothetical protein